MDAYRNYTLTLFDVASSVTDNARVTYYTIDRMASLVSSQDSDKGQKDALKNTILPIKGLDRGALVNSPVKDCGLLQNCLNIGVGSQVNPLIQKTQQ